MNSLPHRLVASIRYRAPALLGLLTLVVAQAGVLLPARATEMLLNGNFETQPSGLPSSWEYNQGDGPATLQDSTNSPFTSVYVAGTKSVLLTEGNTALFPQLIQSFANQTGIRYASWDFLLTSLPGGDNFWTVQIDDGVTALTRFDMDRNGQFAFEQNATFTDVLALTANTWYHVELTLNISTKTFTGLIQPNGDSITTFGGNFRSQPGGAISLNRWVLIDPSADPNGSLRFDNASFRDTPFPVPEPAGLTIAAGALVGGIAYRRSRRKA